MRDKELNPSGVVLLGTVRGHLCYFGLCRHMQDVAHSQIHSVCFCMCVSELRAQLFAQPLCAAERAWVVSCPSDNKGGYRNTLCVGACG